MTSKYMYNVCICLVENVIICLKYMMTFRLYEIQECVCVMLYKWGAECDNCVQTHQLACWVVVSVVSVGPTVSAPRYR